jgi:molecular chaperone DnaK
VPQIEVTFDIDANGILNVSALDKGTGRQQSIRISNTGGLSSLEVERMRQEAQIYSDHDRRQQELAQLKNQADSLVYSYTSILRENGSLIQESLKQRSDSIVNDVRVILGSDAASVEVLKARLEQLQALLLELGTAVYHGSPKQPPTYGTPNVAQSDPNLASAQNSGSWNGDNENTFVGDIDETVITDYEAVD